MKLIQHAGQDNQLTSNLKGYQKALHSFDPCAFEKMALALFHFQADKNNIYKQYISHLKIVPQTIRRIDQIPFLPISFFRTQKVISDSWKEDAVFLSSTTTNTTPSQHYVKDLMFYYANATRIFHMFYDKPDQFHFLALLPSYTENSTSSLAAMVHHFIKKSKSTHSGFYLQDWENLCKKLHELKKNKKKTILWGVSFALMDFAESHQMDLSNCIIIETGGMKGRREEITRADMHAFLCHRFNVKNIHSEYGMTELLSQAYAHHKGQFRCPNWMKVVIRDLTDPFEKCEKGRLGGINIIDLANIYTCSFIETQDVGICHKNGYFEVLGRVENADIRGCNLSIA